jgi:hypothetical protein
VQDKIALVSCSGLSVRPSTDLFAVDVTDEAGVLERVRSVLSLLAARCERVDNYARHHVEQQNADNYEETEVWQNTNNSQAIPRK